MHPHQVLLVKNKIGFNIRWNVNWSKFNDVQEKLFNNNIFYRNLPFVPTKSLHGRYIANTQQQSIYLLEIFNFPLRLKWKGTVESENGRRYWIINHFWFAVNINWLNAILRNEKMSINKMDSTHINRTFYCDDRWHERRYSSWMTSLVVPFLAANSS